MTPEDEAQRDREHLSLLAAFHIVLGAIGILAVGVGVFQWVVMKEITKDFGFLGSSVSGAMDVFGILFVAIPVVFALASLACIYSGLRLKVYRGRHFSQCVAGALCLAFPLGTVLGVATLIVLSRPSTIRLYGA